MTSTSLRRLARRLAPALAIAAVVAAVLALSPRPDRATEEPVLDRAAPTRVTHHDGAWLREEALGFELRDPGTGFRAVSDARDRKSLVADPTVAAWALTDRAGTALALVAMRPGPRSAERFADLVDGLGRSAVRLARGLGVALPDAPTVRAIDWDGGVATLTLRLPEGLVVDGRAVLIRPPAGEPTFVIAVALGPGVGELGPVIASLRETATATAAR